MKLIRLATVAVLTSTIFAGGAQAFAGERHSDTTDNKVTFEAGGGEVDIEPPVEYPPVDIEDPNPASGPFTISHVPKTFDFGTNQISLSDEYYYMAAELENATEDSEYEGKVPYVSFAQVIDTRGIPDSNWALTLSLTEFTNEDGRDLRGAQLELILPEVRLHQSENTELFPVAHTNGTSDEGDLSLLLEADGSVLPVMTAVSGQGQGRSSIHWGDSEHMMAQYHDEEHTGPVLNEAIRLHIPASAIPDTSTYEATLTWVLSSTVSPDGETGGTED
ncbi:WxL domain-containing protein [Enterococcus casseliflavus]|uniref:WxL domain-containing protein n=1 Tax=Enterococcus casseliflavus TaxID=37734 RepID=UPI0014333D53|nr:WxL domain-containing protein [Enterococcus casseliflavus]NKD31640.1 WxL domain-containing protein [Enterococcus casseliflavus]